MSDILDKWCSILGWSKSDGDCPGHWKDKKAGNQLIWTTKYTYSGGSVTPQELKQTERMSLDEVILELEQYLYHDAPSISAGAGKLLHERGKLKGRAKSDAIYQFEIRSKKFIADARRHAQEYLAWFDPPSAERYQIKKYRPEWGPPEKEPGPDPEPVVDTYNYPPQRPRKPQNPDYWQKGRGSAADWEKYNKQMEEYEKDLEQYERAR